jgi:hypothetical protein
MGPLDALWHLLNFMGPAVGVGGFAAALAKLLWWRELRTVGWLRLALWGGVSSLTILVAGLAVYGHDGKTGTYVAMVLACALALWWAAFGPGRR